MRYVSHSWATIPRQPIVDTNLLFDFLLWRFSDSLKILPLLAELKYLKAAPYRASLQWYFKIAKPITTCPEVIAEIHGHAERTPGLQLKNFWKFAQSELAELGLNEELIKVVDMDADILSTLGPTDTALLRLGMLYQTQKQPILTEDTKLAGHCRKRELSIITKYDVLSVWQANGSK